MNGLIIIMRFNRYIVECKVRDNLVGFLRPIGFNRYIVECKDENIQHDENRVPDLIDTLWNVKDGRCQSAQVRRGRFNRYIVECKDGNADGTQRQRIRI